MKTQVIIPAQNESFRIASLLERLPADLFDVRVSVNGSSDDTATIAADYTDYVYECEQGGKLPAIQHVLRRMGSAALEPVLILDADTIPYRPRLWRDLMVTALGRRHDVPGVVSAPVVFDFDRNVFIEPLVRTAVRYVDTARTRNKATYEPQKGAQFGPNMGIQIVTPSALDSLLDIPHIWPKEDVATSLVIVESHPNATFRQLLHPGAAARTARSGSMQPLKDWMLRPVETRQREINAYRSARPADDQVLFDDWLATRNNVI